MSGLLASSGKKLAIALTIFWSKMACLPSRRRVGESKSAEAFGAISKVTDWINKIAALDAELPVPLTTHRFNTELLPRIAERVQQISRGTLHTDILPAVSDQPARLRVWASARPSGGRYSHPVDITLSWDSIEVDRLFADGGDARFAEYLEALAAKLGAWQEPRKIDFNSRTQADPTVLIGGLDFERLPK